MPPLFFFLLPLSVEWGCSGVGCAVSGPDLLLVLAGFARHGIQHLPRSSSLDDENKATLGLDLEGLLALHCRHSALQCKHKKAE